MSDQQQRLPALPKTEKDEQHHKLHQAPNIKTANPAQNTTTLPSKSEKDEQPALNPTQDSDTYPGFTPNEKDTQSTTLSTETSHDIIVEKTIYTHARGHKCDRKHCNPIIITKHGVTRPDQPTTSHSHLSGSCDKGGQQIKPKQEQNEDIVKLKQSHNDDSICTCTWIWLA